MFRQQSHSASGSGRVKAAATGKGANSSSLDLGRQDTSDLSDSLTLWGPGVKAQGGNPSSIMTQSLYEWRKESAQMNPAQAAEELDKYYANLPPEAVELTFKDMIRRSISPKRQLPNSVNEEAEKNGKTSIGSRIVAMLSPKRHFNSPEREGLTPAQLDKLVEARQKKAGKGEGLYSASSTPPSTTPATSFRRVSPFTSPKKLSPTSSFTNMMLSVDKESIEKELAKSSKSLESFLHMDDTQEGPSRQEVPKVETPKDSYTARVQENKCSSCSAPNQFFHKTTFCLACGKSYCEHCRNRETREGRDGRRCKKNCEEYPEQDIAGYMGKKKNGQKKPNSCWTSFGSCIGKSSEQER